MRRQSSSRTRAMASQPSWAWKEPAGTSKQSSPAAMGATLRNSDTPGVLAGCSWRRWLGIDSISVPAGAAGTLGLSLSTNGFQAVMGFLESHGDLQILSSPRVATLNNQKAVLKVGTDDFFVTEADPLPFAGVYRGKGALRELFTTVMGMP